MHYYGDDITLRIIFGVLPRRTPVTSIVKGQPSISEAPCELALEPSERIYAYSSQ